MANPQVSARVTPDVYQAITAIVENRGISKSDVVKELIVKGLSSKEINVPEQTITDSARRLAEEQMRTKQMLEDCKKTAHHWKMKANYLQAKLENTNNQTNEGENIEHPLLAKMKKGKFILERDDEEVTINSIYDLLDFIQQYKS